MPGGSATLEEFLDVHGHATPIKPGGCGAVYGHQVWRLGMAKPELGYPRSISFDNLTHTLHRWILETSRNLG
jgi:hypothetical protein